MELGGHAPFIAFPDVPVLELVRAAVDAKFATSGQDCLAANRILVHDDVHDAFLASFGDAIRSLKVGDGFGSGIDIGPLQHQGQIEKCEAHVRDALEKGAQLVCGGKRHELGGLFFEPTLLHDVKPGMDIWHEETFGPVAAVSRFSSEDQVTQLANDTMYGLAAYVFARDIGVCNRVVATLRYGMVGVNSVRMTGPPIPFGGLKQSGFGREGSHHGLDVFMDLKYVCVATESK
jgi:aspartate-semialdehyde dehydrogenase